jgi:hypothetical protein
MPDQDGENYREKLKKVKELQNKWLLWPAMGKLLIYLDYGKQKHL